MEGKLFSFADLFKYIRQTISNLPQDLYEFLVSFDKSIYKNRSKTEVLDWSRAAFTKLYNFYHDYGKTNSTLSTHICLALARLNDVITPYLKHESDVYEEFLKIYKQLCKIADDRMSTVVEFNYLEGYNPKYTGLYYS